MMDSRILALLLGCLVGFVAGYLVRSVREINRKVDEVDKHVKEIPRDSGLVRIDLLERIALGIVVLLVTYASIQSQRASDRVKDNQAESAVSQTCTKDYLKKTITALNARTQYTLAQTNANVTLQKEQARFLSGFLPKAGAHVKQDPSALPRYVEALTEFVKFSTLNANAVTLNPYPTDKEFSDCLSGKK